MEYRRLGSSDLDVSVVGIGTAPIGSSPAWRIDWGVQDEGEAVRAIQAAIDEGVNWIDTAPFYGWGRAEEIVGRAIRGRRDGVFVFTKCGTFRDAVGNDDHMDLSPAAIRADLEGSLRRLGVDQVDLLQPHDVDPDVLIEESWAEVHRLIAEGKVRHGGLSNHGIELMQRAQMVGPVIAAQHRFNMVAREIERDVLPFCRDRGIGVLSWGSLAEGLLTEGFDVGRLEGGDFRRTRPNFQEPRYGRIRMLTRELATLAAAEGHRASDLALAWQLSRPGMTAAIVGIRSVEEAHALLGAGSWGSLPSDLIDRAGEALARFEDAAPP